MTRLIGGRGRVERFRYVQARAESRRWDMRENDVFGRYFGVEKREHVRRSRELRRLRFNWGEMCYGDVYV